MNNEITDGKGNCKTCGGHYGHGRMCPHFAGYTKPVEAGNPASVATPAAASAGEAGTIERLARNRNGCLVPDPSGDYVRYADHLQHVAAAGVGSYKAGYRAGEGERAATAPVSAVPSAGADSGARMHDVVDDLRRLASSPVYSPNECADTMRAAANTIESLRAGFWNYAGIVATPPSAGAPVCEHDFHYFGDQPSRRCNKCNAVEPAGAPVSAAERDWRAIAEGHALQCCELEAALTPRLWTDEHNAAWHRNIPDVVKAFQALLDVAKGAAQADANSPQTRMDAQSKPLLEWGKLPGQRDLPPPRAVFNGKEMEWEFGEPEHAVDLYTAQQVLNYADQRLLAMRQPQGDDARDAARYRLIRDAKPNSLTIERNGDHSCNYVTAADWIENYVREEFADCDPAELQRMKDTDTIWKVQIYPNTPIGFNWWFGATLDSVIDAASADLAAKQAGKE